METSSRPSLYKANLSKLCRLQQISSLEVARTSPQVCLPWNTPHIRLSVTGRIFFHKPWERESSSSDKETWQMPRRPWLPRKLSKSGSISRRSQRLILVKQKVILSCIFHTQPRSLDVFRNNMNCPFFVSKLIVNLTFK